MSSIQDIWVEDFRVQSFHMDPTGRALITSICNLLQEGASMHAEKAGFGFEKMYSRNQFWVLTRLKVVVDTYPHWMDELTLQTWSRGNNGIFYLRDFFIKNNRQETIVRATSSWAALNTKTRRPELVAGLEDGLHTHAETIALEDKLEKLPELHNPVLMRTRLIEYTDIDIVFHVNNVKYIEMIINSFPKEKHIKNCINSIELNYLGEALYSDTVAIHRDDAVGDAHSDLVGIVRTTDNKEICRAMLGWLQR